jgi:hypothetical protein
VTSNARGGALGLRPFRFSLSNTVSNVALSLPINGTGH